MNKERFNEMSKIQQAIKGEFDGFTKYLPPNSIKYFTSLLAHKFTSSPPIRSYFLIKIYNCLLDEELDIQINKNAFLVEVAVTIMYLENQILDKKNEVTTEDKINQNLLSSHVLKNLLNIYIKENYNSSDSIKIIDTFNDMFYYFDIGQYIDKNLTTFNVFNNDYFEFTLNDRVEDFIKVNDFQYYINYLKDKLNFKNNFIELYFKRTFLINAAMFELMVVLLFKLLNKQDEKILKFARNYGMILQLVNDVIDYTPSVFDQNTFGKMGFDALSDLKSKNITLPLIIYLSKRKDLTLIDEFLINTPQNFTHSQELEILRTLKSTNSIQTAIKFIKKYAGDTVLLLGSPKTEYDSLKDLLEIAWTNRFYSKIRSV